MDKAKFVEMKTSMQEKIYLSLIADSIFQQAVKSVDKFQAEPHIKTQLALAVLCGSVANLISKKYKDWEVGKAHALKNIELYLQECNELDEEEKYLIIPPDVDKESKDFKQSETDIAPLFEKINEMEKR